MVPFSYCLVLVPVGLLAYYRYRVSNDVLANVTLIFASAATGILAVGVQAGHWPLVFVQLAIVPSVTYWVLRRPRQFLRDDE